MDRSAVPAALEAMVDALCDPTLPSPRHDASARRAVKHSDAKPSFPLYAMLTRLAGASGGDAKMLLSLITNNPTCEPIELRESWFALGGAATAEAATCGGSKVSFTRVVVDDESLPRDAAAMSPPVSPGLKCFDAPPSVQQVHACSFNIDGAFTSEDAAADAVVGFLLESACATWLQDSGDVVVAEPEAALGDLDASCGVDWGFDSAARRASTTAAQTALAATVATHRLASPPSPVLAPAANGKARATAGAGRAAQHTASAAAHDGPADFGSDPSRAAAAAAAAGAGDDEDDDGAAAAWDGKGEAGGRARLTPSQARRKRRQLLSRQHEANTLLATDRGPLLGSDTLALPVTVVAAFPLPPRGAGAGPGAAATQDAYAAANAPAVRLPRR
jgi:hypothetical protein